MKQMQIAVFLLFSLISASCESKERKETNSPELVKLQKEVKEAVQATKDYTAQQKANFVNKSKTDLAEIEAELNALTAEIKSARKDAQDEANARLQRMRDKASELDRQRESLKKSGEPAWNDLKGSFTKSTDDLKNSIKDARRWLADKIAP
jgi:hypothetical protein